MQKTEKTKQKVPFIITAFVIVSLLSSTPALAKKKKKKPKTLTIDVYTKAGARADEYRLP